MPLKEYEPHKYEPLCDQIEHYMSANQRHEEDIELERLAIKYVWREIANKIKELCRIDTSLGLYNEALMALDVLKWLKEQIELQGQNDQSTNSIS